MRAVFYALLTLAIVIVFFAARCGVWSLFGQLRDVGLIGLMFIAGGAMRQGATHQRQERPRTSVRLNPPEAAAIRTHTALPSDLLTSISIA